MVALENVFEKMSLTQYLPLPSLDELYLKASGLHFNVKTPSCEDLSGLLMATCNILADKHNFALFSLSVEIQSQVAWTVFMNRQRKLKVYPKQFQVLNSISFAKNECFQDS